jgi:lactobin A/cerein 7B family class IIb bacteriocin
VRNATAALSMLNHAARARAMVAGRSTDRSNTMNTQFTLERRDVASVDGHGPVLLTEDEIAAVAGGIVPLLIVAAGAAFLFGVAIGYKLYMQ